VIYFVRSGDAVKIGYADQPDKRIPTLRTANPNALVVLGVMDGTMTDEQELHQRFAAHRLRGEWFVLCDEIIEFIERSARPYLRFSRRVGVVPTEAASYTLTDGDRIWVVLFLFVGLAGPVVEFAPIYVVMPAAQASACAIAAAICYLTVLACGLVVFTRFARHEFKSAIAQWRYKRLVRSFTA
jgi:hypothetical protein